jgi:NADH dehydrogenase FAD-containing subunit
MGKHLVLVGGGHAHMVTLANLQTFMEIGHRVTVIGPSSYHYYSGMGPGMLSKIYAPDDIRFATRHVVEKQGGTFVLGKVTHINPKEKIVFLGSGDTLTYDVMSFNTGSYVPRINDTDAGEASTDIFSVKPIERLQEAQNRILELIAQKEIRIGITGGGAAAIEVAGNVWRLCRDSGKNMPQIMVFAGNNFMARYHPKIQRLARQSLIKREIELIEGGYVKAVKTGRVTVDTDQEYDLDFIFLSHGVKPSPIFKASGLPTGPDGGLLVNRFLQSTEYPEIFGGGDCIYFQDRPLDKVGVYAVRENPILYHNLMASLEGNELQPFDPGGDYLLVFNMGDGTGILMKRWVIFGGRLAFFIKNYIDCKFMKKFQSIE